jgi:dolichol-phosphate mannosyltransferase
MTILRAAAAWAAPLLHDEAYYWLWARRLDWSYLDHPPMIAYLIRVAIWGGDGELWVRLPALVLGVAASWLLFLLGREMFDARAGLLAVILYQVTPILGGAGSFSAPDSPMYVAWIAILLLTWQAMHGRSRRWWGAGLAAGLGMLSKLYTAVLGVGLGFYLLVRERAWLRRGEPYLAALVALIVFMPVLYWNWTHDWAMVRFLLYERAEPGAPPGPGAMRRLLLQHLPLGLFLVPAFVWGIWAAWRRRADPRFSFLLLTSLPALVLPFIVAPAGAARGHLPGPGYIGLAVVLAALWSRGTAVLAAANATALVIFAALLLVPSLPAVPGAREYYGWREAGARAAEEVRGLGGRAVLVANRFQVAAQLGYHTRDTIPVLLMPEPNPASIWPSLRNHAGASAVAITYAPERFEWESRRP